MGASSPGIEKSTQWLRLLHYRPTLLHPGSKSLDQRFFYAPDGKINPKAELEATIKAFVSDPQQRCRFPARFQYLKQHIDTLSSFTLDHCLDLQNWVYEFGLDRIDLIYAGAYPNNPASLFGHTLLRFHKNGRHPLLDYGVAFLAQTDNDGFDLLHTWRGITGGYTGFFEIEIFSVSVGLYNNSDSRDLWAYELNLTPSQRKTVLYHLWELSNNTGFRYYFLSENCSFMLLALLEVALPDIELIDELTGFVLPLETLKVAINKIQGSQFIEHRPSIKEKILDRWEKLTDLEKKTATKILKHRLDIQKAKPSIEMTEILIDVLHQDLYSKKSNAPPEQKELNFALGAYRGQFPKNNHQAQTQIIKTAPHQAHSPRRIALNWNKKKIQLQLGLGLHGFMDHSEGYEDFSYIDYLNLSIGFDQSNPKLRLDQFQLIEVNSLQAISSLYPHLSWQLELSLLDEHELLNQLHLMGRGGLGLTLKHHQLTQALFLGLRGMSTLGQSGDRLRGYGEFIQIYRPAFAQSLGIVTQAQWLLHDRNQWYEIQVGLHFYGIDSVILSLSGRRQKNQDQFSTQVTYRF